MSSVRDDAIKEHGKETLHEPHQRIDYNPKFDDYEFGDRGFWCDTCHSKCTLGLDAEEYGHYSGCPHRDIDRTPANNKGQL
ncbi:hypothetical protein C484_10401 [Natrialba taiwanensis DSM 12281]|uniref:Uncharacterized protein n=1 Tax=Natrialba taiwanensis DSM 12281 TaxID=1230458 RepID=L9ZZD3_9EURY|nr:hypothetical protein C484_10401 [Natrialba taiwanensis DSM 12281]